MIEKPRKKERFKFSAQKRAILQQRLSQEGVSSPSEQSIPRRKDNGALPLSFAQERLWFLHQWEPESSWYNISLALRLSDLLDISALESSLRALVQRHEVLRTTFEERLGSAVQVIKPQLSIQIPVIDLSGWQGLAGDDLVSKLVRLEAQRPFDLSRGPLLRVSLLRLNVACGRGQAPTLQAPQKHVLLLTLHHIVTDAWSMGVLMREWMTLYQAKMKGEPSPLPELPIQYADYALWQRSFLQGVGSGIASDLDAQLAYWRKQLADLDPLELPTDYLRPRVKTDRGARQSRLLPKAVSDGLLHLCQKQDVTPFILLLTSFQVLLMRYTGQTDISVGTPIANRGLSELEGLIGFFVNTLVLRTDLSGNPTFDLLLARVREVCLQAYMHQDVPFEKVVEELAPQRDLSRSPLFQVMLVMRGAGAIGAAQASVPFPTPAEGGIAPTQDLTEVGDARSEPRPTSGDVGILQGNDPMATVPVITPLAVESVTSKFDLTLFVFETASGVLGCVLEYSTDLFEAGTITRMLEHFQTLLEGIVQDPQAHIVSLPLLTEAECEQLLVDGNATKTGGTVGTVRGSCPPLQDTATTDGASPPLQDVCLHQLFSQQVAQTPDGVAVVFEDVACGFTPHLTYQQLNDQANQLAYRLRGCGVGPDVLVGVCLERSLELVIALLAVLKAGGAYVPLDPELPQERFTWTLSDAQVSVVLTQAHLQWLVNGVDQGPHPAPHLRSRPSLQNGNQMFSPVVLCVRTNIIGGRPQGTLTPTNAVGHVGTGVSLTKNGQAGNEKPLSALAPFERVWVAPTDRGFSYECWPLEVQRNPCPYGAPPHLLESMPQGIAPTEDNDPTKIASPNASWYQNGDHPAPPAQPDNLAYLIYTSGSTGRPKGTMISHANVVRLFAQMQDRFHFQSGDVWTLFHSSAFDFSVWEMWGALLYGGRLVVVPYWLSRSPDEFYRYLVAEQVTVLNQTPSAFRQLIEAEQTCAEGMDLALRLVIFGGEALELSCLGPWFARHGDQNPQLVNMYGITETTVHVTCLPLTQATMQAHRGRSGSPIGDPLADLQCYVLDAYQQPVPLGVPGELYIGGMGLSRGYWQRADVTAERFIPHPFVGKGAEPCTGSAQDKVPVSGTTPASFQPGARLYRTGDLVRTLATGEMEYLGRIDSQVKLRGYRIELGEIEAILRSHMTVQENVVVVREERPDEKQLVAYVVPVAGKMTQTWSLDLRQHLQRHLPTYMIPAQFVVLSALPRNANGKVDRHALPEPGLMQESRHESAGVPSTPLQELLVVIWKEVLHLTQVDIHDNFFELGGHSLLATQAVSRIRRALAVDVPLRSLFEAPTVAQLSSHLEELIRGSSSTLVPDLLPIEHGSSLPLSFAQERLWFLYQWEPDSPWYNIARALCLSGPLYVSVLERSLTRVVQRHEVLRTTFEERSGHPVQVIKPKLFVQIPVIDLCSLVTAEQDQQITELQHLEAQRPFDLSRGPLLRACLLRHDVACDGGTLGKGATSFPTLQAPQEHVLLLTLHHIITDAWSMRVLVHEMTTLYQADLEGEPSEQTQDTVPTLPELPIQYADYTLWQREFLQGEALDEQMAYWRVQLADLSPLTLPTDHPRPRVQTDRGAIQSLRLSRTLSDELLHLCQKLDVTLFMLLLATFQVLLMRYTGQTDISVGTPIANRTRAELEGLIGFFINTLVLRTDLGGDPTFDLLLARVREVCLQAYMHQDVPFEKVVEELAPQRDLSRSPLFQVMLVLLNAPLRGGMTPTQDLAEVAGAGSEPRTISGASPMATAPVITALKVESVTSKFDLTLTLSETASGGLACVLEYNTDLFEEAFITRLLAHFQTLLQGIVQNPQARLSDLPLFTEAEREQLLVQWNATKTDSPQDLRVHQFVESQVEQTPDAIAVVFEEASLSYRELNSQANHLAHSLQGLGIGPDVLVGVCMERSLELVIAMLAVLKAGGAYVPLDPDLPRERFIFLLSDAQVPVVLTQAHLQGLMGLGANGVDQGPSAAAPHLRSRPSLQNGDPSWSPAVLCVRINIIGGRPRGIAPTEDNYPTKIASPNASCSQNGDYLAPPVQPDHPAYLIYTSGSTGKPKGAMNTHRGLCNRLLWMQNAYRLTSRDRVLQKTPLSFDVSVWEFFWPLMTGASLVMARPGGHQDPTYLRTVIVQQGVTTLHFVPSMLQAFLQEPDLETCTSLRQVICSGEALTPPLQARFFASVGTVETGQGSGSEFPIQLHNLYGPTEASIDVTFWPCQPDQGHRDSARLLSDGYSVPIGRPITNTQIYLLDRHLQLVPIGVTGELYIGGVGLARGYARRPDLTAERFIANPWSLEPGARLYHTGDLARYRPDGAIEYLGRIDRQVKLRGYRVELGEIEAVLLQHPEIREGVVQIREDEGGEKRLVAYVTGAARTGQPGSAPDLHSQSLRTYLQERLPAYMVPTQFVVLDALPLTANGKLDWRALPAPEQDKQISMQESTRTPLEELLVSLFCEVLGRKQVGISENFFELGGHSLRATQLISRVRTMVSVEVPLRAVFEEPTVAGLSRRVEQALRQGQRMPLPPLVAQPRPEAIPLSFAQERLWFLDQLEPGSTAYLDFRVLGIKGELDVQALEHSLQELIQRHENLRTTFAVGIVPSADPQLVQVIHSTVISNTQNSNILSASIYPELLPVIDLQGLWPEHREGQVQKMVEQEKHTPCDLAHGPLLRTYLLRLLRQEHILLLTLHHIITDGWSDKVFVREWTTLYRAHVSGPSWPVGQTHRLPPLPIQYADYALWQREWLQGEVLEAGLSYWRKQLADLPALVLPTDHPRPRVQSSRGAIRSVQISQEVSEGLQRLCRKTHVTLFMTLLAAFQVLLMRYTGQDDVCVGTPIANRRFSELEGLIGFFVNTLVLRTDLDGDPTFLELLQRVREMCLQAYMHQDVPFEKVVEELAPERDMSLSPLFQVMFVLQNVPLERRTGASPAPQAPVRDLDGVGDAGSKLHTTIGAVEIGQGNDPMAPVPVITPLRVKSVTSMFDLMLSIDERSPEGLHCKLEYNTDLFEEAFILRMLAHFQTLLEGVVQDPKVRLSDLPLLTEVEREQLLVEWNMTQCDSQRDLCLHHLIEQQVERSQDAIAVVLEDTLLTYRELNDQANHLAHCLLGEEVELEVPVGVYMERSLELVIAVLAVLKAGGVYVPLDPELPQERLISMLEDAQIPLVLTQSHLYSPMGPAHRLLTMVKTIRVACGRGAVKQTSNPKIPVQPGNLAYVIYTSGSTGRPKGVMTTHQGISNNLLCKHSDDGLQQAPLGFDVSVEEIFLPLLTGARLVLAHPKRRWDNASLLALIAEQYVAEVNFVPSLLRACLEEPGFEQHPSLRYISCGAEALSVELQERIFAHAPADMELENFYGPTEASIDVTFWECQRRGDDQSRPDYRVPIGRPMANIQIYLLDRNLQLVPIGVPGELYIGGIALARGYINHPDLTAERFVPHPWSSIPGERLYRTGDLAHYRPDGALEYLGRLDRQVKLWGVRIEPDEIEAVLLQHPEIREAVVQIREDKTGTNRLVAYVTEAARTGQSGSAPDLHSQSLHTYLYERLPAYMVPTQFVVLDALPLNANGKLDWLALPTPSVAQDGEVGMQEGTRTPLEELLVSIFCEVLELNQVGVSENFFHLGGHSLLAAQLISRVRTMVGVEIPLRAVFEKPTVAGLARRVEQALRQGQSMPLPPLVALPRPEVIPLSFAQERLWFLDQLEPESTAYLIPSAYRLLGEALHPEYLDQSLQEIIQRHEILRTTFLEREGQPVQVIHPVSGSKLLVIDLQGLSPLHREVRSLELAGQERHRPCDLVQGPLLRMALLRLERQEHILLLTLHHIITDGWSDEVLMYELIQLYQTHVSGQPSPVGPVGSGSAQGTIPTAPDHRLPPLPVQYADYALWQREFLQGEVLEGQLAYWRKQLTDLPALTLPTDHPRPRVQSSRGATLSMQISQEVLEGLLHLCRKAHVTLFMTLLSVFQVLLARYSGEVDLAVGTPIASRDFAEIEELIGFFVNTLVLRTDLGGHPTFLQVLHRVREVCLQAYANADIPFEKVVEVLEPQRDLSRTPLFQVMFALQNTPGEVGQESYTVSLAPAGPRAELSIEPLAAPTASTSRFDLTLSITAPALGGLSCNLEYSTDLFEAPTIMRMLTNFQTLLAGIVQDPQAHISDLPMLTQEEQEQLLVQWNATKTGGAVGNVGSGTGASPVPTAPDSCACPQLRDMCVHQLISQQGVQTPDTIAVVFEEASLTYRELNSQANHLAHHLQGLGIGPDVLVGVCMERSLELVIAMLAVLKAGGAYVPLDLTSPQERLLFMLEDAQVRVVLTQNHLRDRLPLMGVMPICVESSLPMTPLASYASPHPDHLAYLIYTSGSTGQPKGVEIPHRAVSNFLIAMRKQLGIQACDSLLAVTPVSFDIAGLELFLPLLVGARVVLARHAQARDGEQLAQVLREQGTTIMQATPSTWRTLLEADWREKIRVLCGGEAFPTELARQLLDLGATVWNLYGPTETTIWSTLSAVTSVDGPPPIGRPIANTQVYLLDRNLSPVPIGVAGEVFIGGAGLSRGYCKRPEQTAESFLPHLWSSEPGARLYRTGDLARYRPDGAIEYLGRIDRQVKLRGLRIELGEIEAVLLQHPEIREGVVQVREDEGGEKRLVAYVTGAARTGQPGSAPDLHSQSLRTYLQERLPAYMVPTQFIVLDALPLTANGKLDWRALPAPEQNEQISIQERTRTPLEELLVSLFCEVLGRKQVGISENFFELGGHSLRATQLISRVRTMVGVEVPLRAVFEEPTVAGLSKRVEQALRQGQSMPLPPLVPLPRPEAIPLSFAQERLWFIDQLEPESTAYLISSAYHVLGEALNLEYLDQSLQDLIQRHEILRTTFVEREGQPMQMIHPVSGSTLLVIDLQGLSPSHREECSLELAEQETHHPCDLAQGPLLRVSLLRLLRHEQVVLLTLHHIVSDGWSDGVFMHELTQLYQAKLSGQPSPVGLVGSSRGQAPTLQAPDHRLPPLSVQYADYALWQREFLQGEVLEGQMAYWRKQLADLPTLTLPTDYPRPRVQSSRGGTLSMQISQEVSEGLLLLCQKAQVTLFMTLLAAFQVLLARYCGQEDIAVGTSVANRNLTEIEGLIGFFVNTLVLRTDLGGRSTFMQVLQRVREVCLLAYANADIPFERVVQELEPQRDLSRTPLFQVMFDLQGERTSPFPTSVETGQEPRAVSTAPVRGLAEISIELLAVERRTSQFDLSLSIARTASGGLFCDLEYSTDLFNPETVLRLLGHWQVLLEAIVYDPGQTLETLPLLTKEEREQLLVQWNATQADYPLEMTLHQFFERQVELTSDSVALVFENEMLTYRELNRRADQLAHRLRECGVGPEILVGICMQRSPAMLVSILAVFKIGGAYLPLEPSYPEQRLRSLVQESHTRLILTEASSQTCFSQASALGTGSISVLTVESLREPIETENHQTTQNSGENLAYVIYTSGSTGRPKGAMVTQRGMINHLFAKMGTLQLQSTDTIAQTAAASFDISVWQFFAALLVGGRVCIFPDEIAHDPRLLWGRISEQGITVLELVPSLLQAALDTLDNSMEKTALNLHWMLVTGEACPMGLVNRWGECCPQIPLVNAYGPTECSDDVTQAVLVPATDMQIQTAPIGRPLANTQIYLLDEQMRPVPIGVPGEIYVGGIGVGRGYLSDPVRTALAFVPHPFVAGTGLIPASCTSPYPGERLYRTGDMALYRNNGEIEFIGRRDQQVKLHGFRIELGEIEATLMRHVAVREAVVLAQEDSSGERRLVAYVVAEAGSAQGTTPTAPALRSYLQEHLPAYMIPTLIVPLDALPLTPNGKVDRKALPVPERGQDFKNTETASGRPQTPLQEQLALIWAELLHVQEIGIHDNFFELGGHSLLAVQLLNRINKQFGPWRRARGLQALSLAALFQAPTIEQVSALLQTSVGSLSTSSLVTLQPMEQTHRQKARPPLFCVHDGMGALSGFFRLVKHLRHDRPYYGIQAPALRGDGGLFNSVEEMATSYIDELLAVQPSASPYFLMGYSLGGLVAFEMARQLQAQGRSVALLAILDTQPDPQDTTVEMGQAIVLEQLLEIVEALVHNRKEVELLPYEELYRLQPDEQLAYFLEKLVEAGVVPEDMDIAQLRRHRQIYEMHDICSRRYRPQPYLGRITLFRSEDGEIDPSLWIPLSSEPIEVHTVSGNHNTIVVEPYVQSLAAQLQQCLDKADEWRHP